MIRDASLHTEMMIRRINIVLDGKRTAVERLAVRNSKLDSLTPRKCLRLKELNIGFYLIATCFTSFCTQDNQGFPCQRLRDACSKRWNN